MIFKLSLKSIRFQYYHYLVYLVGMIFAVTIYYSFNAVADDYSLLNSIGRELDLRNAMSTGSLLIIGMIITFMLTVNRFFFFRRVKEIGVYQLVGMKKRQIMGIFFSEIFILGAAALLIGLFLGIIFSRLFSMILIKAMFLNVESVFRVSVPAIIKTALVFIFMLGVVSVHSSFLVYYYQFPKIFEKQAKALQESKGLLKRQLFLGIGGLGLILLSYGLTLWIWSFFTVMIDMLSLLLIPLIIVTSSVVGTYLFFKYTIHIFIYVFNQRKRSYYQGITMLVANNTRFHLYRGSNTLTAVTVFVACALIMIGGTASFYTLSSDKINATDPTDFIVAGDQYAGMKETIEKESSITEAVTLHFKLIGSRYTYTFNQREEVEVIEPVNILSLSNYRQYQKINPYLKPVVLKEGKAVMLGVMQDAFAKLITYDSSIYLAEGIRIEADKVIPDYIGDSSLRYNKPTIIVSDKIFKEVNEGVSYDLTAFNVKESEDIQLLNRFSEAYSKKWQKPIYYQLTWANQQVNGYVTDKPTESADENSQMEEAVWQLNYTSRFSDWLSNRKSSGVLMYIVVFLGMLAFIITGSVLMVRQFAEAEREKTTYDLIRNLGVSEKQIKRLIYQQNSIVFFVPMLIGIFHAVFAIRLFNQIIPSSGYWLAYLSCGLLMLIYLVYYVMTSKIYFWLVSLSHVES